MIASLLFTWLQGAGFYRDLHRRAVKACRREKENRGWMWVAA
jgi:hypothetical protein